MGLLEIAMAAKTRSRWYNKQFDVLGDSITFMNLWQPHVKSALDTKTFLNHGVSGSQISGALTDSMCGDTRINALTATADAFLVMGGTNDWANNVSIGTGETTDVSTFLGAYRVLLQKLQTRFPTKRIFVMTTPYGEVPNRAGWTDTAGIINNNGLSTRDYANAAAQAAGEYGAPVIDISGEMGSNKVNILQFIQDEDTMRVHPNADGAKRIAEVVIGRLREIDPL